jgi:tetratricopeptide (TPR) repeat protein
MRLARFPLLTALLCAALALQTARAQNPPRSPPEPPAPAPSVAAQQILIEAARLLQAKSLQEALQAANRALVAAKQAADGPGEALAHRARALSLEQLGRRDEALAAWREAAGAWERAGDGPGQVEALARQALLLGERPEEAQKLLQQALALAKAETKRPLASATRLFDAALRASNLRLPGPARHLAEAALAIREHRMPGSTDVATTLYLVGYLAYGRGDLPNARESFQRALALYDSLAPGSPDMAKCLNMLGNVADDQGELEAAKGYYLRALAIREKAVPGSYELAGTLLNLGLLATHRGELAEAADLHGRALAILERVAPGSAFHAHCLGNLGVVAHDQGDLDAAKELYRRALTIYERLAANSLEVAASLHNLGDVAGDQGDLDAAEEFYRRALQIKERLAPDSLSVATSLNSLGIVAWSRGDAAGAKELYRRALEIYERLAPNSLTAATSLHNLGAVARHQGDLTAARDYYLRALATQERLAPESLGMAASLRSLGNLASDQGDLGGAVDRLGRAWQIVRGQAGRVTGDEARQAFGAYKASYAANLLRCQLAQGRPAEAFVTLEEGRAQALQQLLAERAITEKLVPPELWQPYRQAKAAQDRAYKGLEAAGQAESRAQAALEEVARLQADAATIVGKRQALESAKERTTAARSDYTRALQEAQNCWAAVKKAVPLAFPPPRSLAQDQRFLPTGTLFVAFAVGERESAIFLVRPLEPMKEAPAVSAYPLAIGEAELRQLVETFRARLEQRGTIMRSGRELFARLFPAAAQSVIGQAQRLVISPDGPLWELPFAALVVDEAGGARTASPTRQHARTDRVPATRPRFLGLEKPIAYAQSLTVFVQSRRQPPHIAPGISPVSLVLGNPVFDLKPDAVTSADSGSRRPRGERWLLWDPQRPPSPLPGTAAEAAAVARLYRGAPLLKLAATEAALRQRIGEADIIHLATHGFLHPKLAMSSGLLLTPPEKEPDIGQTSDDGCLQAWEIQTQLRLKAELVVLSACETGRGRNVQAEGIVGLARALQYAGARSILASQWSVADESTAALMVAFHRNLRASMAKDEALRQAMLVVKQHPGWSDPLYWAPFILIGDPDNPNLGAGGQARRHGGEPGSDGGNGLRGRARPDRQP